MHRPYLLFYCIFLISEYFTFHNFHGGGKQLATEMHDKETMEKIIALILKLQCFYLPLMRI